jgi:hypothetical protein
MLSKVPQVSHTSCTTSSIPSEDTSFLDHLESHYLGELPQSSFNTSSQTASKMASKASASEKVTSESPQHHEPEPQKPSPEKTSSPPQQSIPPPTVLEPYVPEQSIPKQTVPEHIVPEQPVTKPIPESETTAPEHHVPESTSSSTTSLPVQVIKITHYTGVCEMDTDSEDDQADHASDMVIDSSPNQPSTSQPLTTNGQPPNLTIIPLATPKPSKQPSPLTIFLNSQVLKMCGKTLLLKFSD